MVMLKVFQQLKLFVLTSELYTFHIRPYNLYAVHKCEKFHHRAHDTLFFLLFFKLGGLLAIISVCIDWEFNGSLEKQRKRKKDKNLSLVL
jgi:hypothetical protein